MHDVIIIGGGPAGVAAGIYAKRAGLDTVGKLVDRINGSEDLKGIRNCGAKSIREIMEHLFLFQYYSLKPEARTNYLLEVVAMNKV